MDLALACRAAAANSILPPGPPPPSAASDDEIRIPCNVCVLKEQRKERVSDDVIKGKGGNEGLRRETYTWMEARDSGTEICQAGRKEEGKWGKRPIQAEKRMNEETKKQGTDSGQQIYGRRW